MAVWLGAIESNDGTVISFIEPSITLTKRINGASTASLSVNARSSQVGDLGVANRSMTLYRNNERVLRGKIWEPLFYRPDFVTFDVHDPWSTLGHRRVRTPITFTAQDAGEIAWDLIAAQNALSSTHLSEGTITASDTQTVTYDRGKIVSEAILELADAANFYFRLDPVATAGYHAEFVVEYPDSGDEQVALRFEYGAGTISNISEFEVAVYLPRNRITTTGTVSEGESSNSEVVSDASSISTYGLFEHEIAFSSQGDGTLADSATAELRTTPAKTYSITPHIDAPMLWDDFVIGDTIGFRILNGDLDESGEARIVEATVNVTDGGSEYMSGLVIQVV